MVSFARARVAVCCIETARDETGTDPNNKKAPPMKLLTPLLLVSAILLSPSLLARDQNYLIGRGLYDITGPAAEVGLFGYAVPEQVASGIHDRQWARAFIIADRQADKRVVFVNIDSGAVFQS